jgi:mortality factor 4-like protein 1
VLVLPASLKKPFLIRDVQLQEAEFHARPSIKLLIPDHIKAILVDDWENVTKNQQLVPLPSAHPVNSILNDYLEFERPKRQPASAQADILEEVVAGLKEYFDKCLGRILLYR